MNMDQFVRAEAPVAINDKLYKDITDRIDAIARGMGMDISALETRLEQEKNGSIKIIFAPKENEISGDAMQHAHAMLGLMGGAAIAAPGRLISKPDYNHKEASLTFDSAKDVVLTLNAFTHERSQHIRLDGGRNR